MQRALDFLQEHNEVALATVCNNKPDFATSPKKAVWQQLQDNPNIELLASADRISVRCKGAVS